MTKRIFRADHCGSLIRPDKLRRARIDRLHGRIDDADACGDRGRGDPRRAEDAARCRHRNLFRRRIPPRVLAVRDLRQVLPRLRGPRHRLLALSARWRGKDMSDREEFVPQVPVVVDRLRPKGRITGDEIAFLKKHSPGTFKMTLPSPVMLVPFAVPSRHQRPRLSDLAGFLRGLHAADGGRGEGHRRRRRHLRAGRRAGLQPLHRAGAAEGAGARPGARSEQGARHRACRRERAAARGQARRRHGRGAHLPRHLHPRPARAARRRRLDLRGADRRQDHRRVWKPTRS